MDTVFYNTRSGEIVRVTPLGTVTPAQMAGRLHIYRDRINAQLKAYYRARKKHGPDSPRTHRAEAKLFRLGQERDQIKTAFDTYRRGGVPPLPFRYECEALPGNQIGQEGATAQ